MIWENKSFYIYYRAYSAFYCQNIPQATSFAQLNYKAINNVSSVFQMQTLILAQ